MFSTWTATVFISLRTSVRCAHRVLSLTFCTHPCIDKLPEVGLNYTFTFVVSNDSGQVVLYVHVCSDQVHVYTCTLEHKECLSDVPTENFH